MEKKVCVFLADGFEEIEGLTVVDLLRRAGIFVTTVSITGKLQIRGSHDICVQADKLFEEMDYEEQDMVVLPGGMPGTIHLEEHEGVKNVLEKYYEEKKYIAAICAAPSIFGKMGFLKERKATSYPSKEAELFGAELVKDSVVVSDFIITSRGLGTAIDFSLALIGLLLNKEKAEEIKDSVIYQCK